MSQASFFIYMQNLSAWAVEISTGLNALILLELAINSFIDRNQLSSWVGGRWREDVMFSAILGLAAELLLYAPRWISQFGREIYVIAIFCYLVQILLNLDYKKLLSKKLEKGWYRISNVIAMILGIASMISVILFFISTIAVQDF